MLIIYNILCYINILSILYTCSQEQKTFEYFDLLILSLKYHLFIIILPL